MKTSVNDAASKVCPSCGKALPAGAPAGLCPACLLAQGMQTDPELSGASTRFVPPPLDEITQLFPQLEVISLLGAGGMGAVYKARQPALDRMVALKILPATGGGALSEERFNREARALARLSHPNIVGVHEFGRAGNLHFFIMEFVDGANLRQLQRSALISPKQALQIIPQICDALQYAHDEGVVHRDIKPENVLMDRKGRVKIADFGLAKIVGSDPEAGRLTVDGQVMGTPHYMAPEQVERPLAVDHRADIYSLGVVFYEMLTGDLPLGKFPPPSRKVHVDVRLDDVVLRALENDPERRYQNASEVKQRVENIAGDATAAAVPDNRPRTPQGTVILAATPSPWGLFRIALAGVGALVVAMVALYFMRSVSGAKRHGMAVDQSVAWTPQTTQMVARLPDRGRVEVVAVGDTRGRWWRPDGTSPADTTYEIRNGPPNQSHGGNDILLRLADLPEGTSGPWMETDPAAGSSGGGDVYVGGRFDRTLQLLRYVWPDGLGTATLRAGLGLGAWRTIIAFDLQSGRYTDRTEPNDPPWGATFHPPADLGGKVQVTMILMPADRLWETRLVAIDTRGDMRFSNQARATPSDSSTTWTYVFPDLALAEVREFRIQVRRMHWIEFKDIKLGASFPLPEIAPRVFSKAMELSFDECIDFDSGTTAGFPAAKPDSNPFEGIGENAQWAHEQGFDAAVANGKLRILDVDVAPLNSDDWNTLKPADVINRLDQNSSRPHTLGPFQAGELPVTYAYRTRENGHGMLRIVAFDPARPGATIQLKRIVRPGEKVIVKKDPIMIEGGGSFPTIQEAIDAAPPGSRIHIPKGIFRENLVIMKPLTLAGNTWENTTIEPAKPWSEPTEETMKRFAERIRKAGSERERDAIQAELKTLVEQPVLQIRGAGRVSLVGIRFSQPGTPAEGKLLPGGTVDIDGASVEMKECAIIGSPASCLEAGFNADVQLYGCLAAAAWNTGIQAGVGSKVRMIDSDVRNCFYTGITAAKGTMVEVSRCRVSGAAWHGIRYDDTSPLITGCMIFGNARSGIYASGRTHATVRENVLFENGMNGMSCWNANADIITRNTFSGNLREAMSVLGTAAPTISSNIFLEHKVGVHQGFIAGRVRELSGKLDLRANIFWKNTADLSTPKLGENGEPVGVNTNLPPDTDNRSVDPGLRDPSGGNFLPEPGSAAFLGKVGAPGLTPLPGPFALQPEEKRMVPDGADRDSRAWKRPASR